MAGSVTVQGTKGVIDALKALGDQAGPAFAQAIYEEAEAVMTTSKEQYVPVDTGVLRGTGYVAPPEQIGPVISVEIGYGGPAAPYALAVHENPRAGKTGGFSPQGKPYKHWARVGSWKYLELPWKEAMAGLIERLEAKLRAKVRALG